MDATKPSKPRQRKPRSKPVRTIGILVPLNDQGMNGVVKITVGKKTDEYTVSRIEADFGQGFALEKVGAESKENTYHVNLDGESRSCSCKGHASHGHCKHADGLAALVAAGRL
jgi:hypothetical protein